MILLPNRPDLEFTEEEWERQNPIDPYPKNVAEVFVAKHRHGPTGKVHLVFRGQVSSFVDLYREVARR